MITNGEMSANSDQIIWQEEGRLHTRYERVWANGETTATIAAASASTSVAATDTYITFTLGTAQAGPSLGDGSAGAAGSALTGQNPFDYSTPTSSGDTTPPINFRVGQTVMTQKENDSSAPVIKGIVTAVSGQSFSMGIYNTDARVATDAGDTFTALVYGSEF